MSEHTFKFRTHGLPPEKAEGQFIGFSEDGRAFVLKWSNEFGIWGAAGWEKPREGQTEMLPVVVACREDMADFIVSHSRLDG